MIYIFAFLVCGLICAIAQIIYEHSTWTAGHITSLFVVIGVLLDGFDLYDYLLEFCGMGAGLPITSFGHSLAHASFLRAQKEGFFGIFLGTFDLTASGIAFAIFLALISAILFKPKS